MNNIGTNELSNLKPFECPINFQQLVPVKRPLASSENAASSPQTNQVQTLASKRGVPMNKKMI